MTKTILTCSKSYLLYVDSYLKKIEEHPEKFNIERILLKDLLRDIFSQEKLYIDDEQVEKYFDFQKYFFQLYDWEKFLFVLHNCVFKENGLPRWKDLFALVGRGSGKNGYLSFEDFCLITPVHGIKKYDIDICATSEEQAYTSFNEIYEILGSNEKYFEKYFYWTQTVIKNLKTGSQIKARTNNAKGKDGLRSGKVDFDEEHAYENWENIKVYTTGLGKKPHPRKTIISSDGDVRGGPLDKDKEKSLKILKGEIPDNGFLPFICKLDSYNEVYDQRNWPKANPSIEFKPDLMSEIQSEYIDFLEDPIIHSSFMTKRMNVPQGNKDREVVDWETIEKTNQKIPNLYGRSCTAGIDYSKTSDFMSASLTFKIKDKYYVLSHSWVCNQSPDLPRIKAPLKDWEKMGLLTFVDDVEINPEIITNWLKEQSSKYKIKRIAIDNYRFTLLSSYLKKIGFDPKDKKKLKLTRPNTDIMRIVPTINSLFLRKKIVFGDNPLMRWAINNTKLEPAPNNNFKYGKIEPKSRKTDPFMSFVHSMTFEDGFNETNNTPSKFPEPIILK